MAARFRLVKYYNLPRLLVLKHSKLGYKEWMVFWFKTFFKTSRVCAFPPATFAHVSSSSSKSLQPTLLPKLLQRWRMTASLPFVLQSLEMNLGANADQRSTQFNLVSRFRPSRRPVKNRRAKGPLRNNWRTRRNIYIYILYIYIDIENPISPDIMWLLFYPHY